MLSACGNQQTPEQEIAALIAHGEAAAEERNVGDVAALVSEHYRDAYGHSRDEVVRMLRGYFLAHQSVHLLTRIESIEMLSTDEAEVTVAIGMLGTGASEEAWDLALDTRSLELTLARQEGDWKVRYAQWGRGP